MRHRRYRRDDFARIIAEQYRRAESFHKTADQLTDSLVEHVWRHADYQKLTRADRGYLHGFHDAMSAETWRKMDWRLGPAEGPLSLAQQDSEWTNDGTGQLSRLCRIPGALYGGHFWHGTDIAYTAYHCTNPSNRIESTT